MNLEWPGTWNARDLGGLRTADGRTVRTGALVRAERLSQMTEQGWQALHDHGVRTLVDLRWREEVDRDVQTPPPGVRHLHLGFEDGVQDDPEFAGWIPNGVFGTPLYYRRFLERWPDRAARAVQAVAHARPGGVLVHCTKGCDRTGLVVGLVLTLLGVPVDDVADDYAVTAARLKDPRAAALGREDDEEHLAEVLLAQGATTPRAAVRDAFAGLDVEHALRPGGLTADDVRALRARLLV